MEGCNALILAYGQTISRNTSTLSSDLDELGSGRTLKTLSSHLAAPKLKEKLATSEEWTNELAQEREWEKQSWTSAMRLSVPGSRSIPWGLAELAAHAVVVFALRGVWTWSSRRTRTATMMARCGGHAGREDGHRAHMTMQIGPSLLGEEWSVVEGRSIYPCHSCMRPARSAHAFSGSFTAFVSSSS